MGEDRQDGATSENHGSKDGQNNQSAHSGGFLTTLPGILTGVGSFLMAITGLIVTLNQIGILGGGNASQAPSSSEPTPVQTASPDGANQTNGTLQVSAKGASEFTNPVQYTETIRFQATGKWLGIPETEPQPSGYVLADGYEGKTCDDRCYCPDIQQGKLIAQSDTRGCIEIGSDGKVTLNPNETVKLFMNDVKDTDADNDGELSVNWSVGD